MPPREYVVRVLCWDNRAPEAKTAHVVGGKQNSDGRQMRKGDEPNRTKRQTAEGDVLEWELLFPVKSPFGSCMPFFIDWLDCANPKDTNPLAGEFQSLSVSNPDATNLQKILTSIGLDVPVNSGEPSLSVSIAGQNGEVILASTPETSRLSLR